MKLSFMTLGCPKWTLDDICRHGRAMGYDAVDFRGLGDALDITTLPAFTTDAEATRRRLEASGLVVSGISSSITVCDLAKRAANLDEARRTIEVAKAMGAGHVRMFGGGDVTGGREAAAAVGAETVRMILDLPGARDLTWGFETHDLWIAGKDAGLLLSAIPDRAFASVWDIAHTLRLSGESAKATYRFLAGRIGYTHIKDAVHRPGEPGSMGDGWRYVPPGTGELPLAGAIRLLRSAGYDGYFMFEHEKRWHPTLPEPEEVFPMFTSWMRGLVEAEAAIPPV